MSSIILVDDEKDLCESLAALLRREFPAFTIQHTTNPLEAKRWLMRERPKLLITDVRMPAISGLELLSMASELWGITSTIVMTAFASAELDKVLELGTFHYLPKPFRNHELVKLVREITKKEEKEGFAGTITVTMLADIVQLHSLAGSTGALVVEAGGSEGEIHFSKGQIVHAIAGTTVGRDAFNQVLSWKSGQFHFLRKKVTQNTIQAPAAELLIDALRMVDEQAHDTEHDITQGKGIDDDSLAQLFAEFSSTEVDAVPKAAFVDGETPNAMAAASLSGTFIAPSTPSYDHFASYDSAPNPSFESIPGTPNAEPRPPEMRKVHNLQATLDKLEGINGFVGACIGDLHQKKIMAEISHGEREWEASSEAHSLAFFEKQAVIASLGLSENIQDIVILSEMYYQVLLLSNQHEDVYFSLLLDRSKANLALAQLTLKEVERQLVLPKRSKAQVEP